MGAAVAYAVEVRDLSRERLRTENELDNAIYALLCAAFGEEGDVQLRRAIRGRLVAQPSPQEVIDAVCAELRLRGRLAWEWQRRATACNVMAAFFDLSPEDRADVSLAPPNFA